MVSYVDNISKDVIDFDFFKIEVMMKLKEIHLKNFRCYEDITIPLDEKLTVLVAPNGMGKTTILDAICLLLNPYIDTFLPNRYKNKYNMSESDIRLVPDKTQKETSYIPMMQLLPCSISVKNTENMQWHLTLNQNTSGEKYNVSHEEIQRLIESANEKVERSKNDILSVEQFPLFLFYGVDRGLGRDRDERFLQQRYPMGDTRFFAYYNCLAELSDYNNAFNWFISLYDKLKAEAFERLEQGETVNMENLSSEFTLVIQEVVDIVLRNMGWGRIRTKTQTYSRSSEILLTHKDFGSLFWWQLSEGICSILGMVMDMAYRCCILNSHLGKNAVKETEGVVLIDEVDMHLHPEWQQTILVDLQEAFPKIQFIVTTHSPQVLSTVKKEHIRILCDGQLSEVLGNTYGEVSSDVMYRVQGVNPRPPIPEREKLNRLNTLVDSGNYESNEVQELLVQLTYTLGETHEAIIRIKRSIERQKLFKKLKQKD